MKDIVRSGSGGLPAQGGGAEPYTDHSRAPADKTDPSGSALVKRDERDMSDLAAMLKDELGADAEATMMLVDDFATRELGEDLWMDLAHARLPDDSLVGNNIELFRLLASLAKLDLWLKQMQESGVSPAPRLDDSRSIEGELAAIEKIMEQDFGLYLSAPVGSSITYQQRYRELQELREKQRDNADDEELDD